MRQPIGAAAAAAALAAASIVATAGSAQADDFCNITGFTPTMVVVGLSPVTKTFNVSTSDCVEEGWSLLLGDYDFYVYEDAPQETFQPYGNDEAGSYSAVADAYNYDYDYDESERSWASAFHLKRRGSFSSFNAGPEPVKKGKAITITGKLLRANWDTEKYQGHTNKDVKVQFRTPTGSFTTVKTVKTNSDGWAKTTVTAQRTGVWQLVFSGNSTSGPATSSGDSVKVD